MALCAEVRDQARATLAEYFPIGADVPALTVGYRRKTTGASVYTVTVLAATDGRIENVSALVVKATGATPSRDGHAVSIEGYPAELIGWVARELHRSSTALTYRKV